MKQLFVVFMVVSMFGLVTSPAMACAKNDKKCKAVNAKVKAITETTNTNIKRFKNSAATQVATAKSNIKIVKSVTQSILDTGDLDKIATQKQFVANTEDGVEKKIKEINDSLTQKLRGLKQDKESQIEDVLRDAEIK